jgi:hypothetical protein
VFNSTPNIVNGASYARGGIWMGGGAPAADSSGNLYVLTGNGTFDADTGGANYGDSTLKLSITGGLGVADWFTPAEQSSLDTVDSDHGAGGAAIIINAPSRNFVIGGGKEGTLFLLDQTNMGHYGANATPSNSNASSSSTLATRFFRRRHYGTIRYSSPPSGGPLQAYPFDTVAGMFNTSNATSASVSFGFPGATPSVSSSGASNGIVWAIAASQYCPPASPSCGAAVLHAFDATKLSSELWNSSQVVADQAGLVVKFTVPTVANGKLYVGMRGNDCSTSCPDTTPTTLGELDVYGLKPN